MVEECDLCAAAIDIDEDGVWLIRGKYERDDSPPYEDVVFDFGGHEFRLCGKCASEVADLFDTIRKRKVN